MSNHATVQKTIENFQQQRKELAEKQIATSTEHSSLQQQHDQAIINHVTVERAHILDQATDQELAAAQQLCNDLAAKLAASNRRLDLIREAITEIDLKINVAIQNLKIARRDFCVSIRSEKLLKIQQHQQIKELIIAAMAAQAANGMDLYFNNSTAFVQKFILQILPEINEQEVIAATEKFIKENGLD